MLRLMLEISMTRTIDFVRPEVNPRSRVVLIILLCPYVANGYLLRYFYQVMYACYSRIHSSMLGASGVEAAFPFSVHRLSDAFSKIVLLFE